MPIDLFEFARNDETASGEAPLAELQRIETSDRSGALQWAAVGSMRGRHGAPRLDLRIDGEVELICQRCLQPMLQPLHLSSRFLVAADEESADRLDQDDDFDVVVDSGHFDMNALIEDEVILALPVAPRHAQCPDGTQEATATVGKPSPFAALAALRRPEGAEPADEGNRERDDEPDA